MRRRLALGMLLAALLGTGSASAAPRIGVRGHRLVDGHGHTVRLLGVNRSGAEYACAQGWGFWDGPVDAGAIRTMKTWGINTVRVPLNEACWLGLASVKRERRGAPYRRQIKAFVGRLQRAGLYVILDLHWNAPGARRALDQQVMADADHSPAFWRSVARTFRRDRGMVFDLYNEPHDISWRCWRDGCRTKGGWRTAGMWSLVRAVRSVGARQPILLGGLGYASDLRGWWRWHPRDPRHAAVAAYHTYGDGSCLGPKCWTPYLAGVYRRVPVVTGELGEYDCKPSYVSGFMRWADAHGVSYLGWAWNVSGRTGCRTGPDLISSYRGTPTPFGRALRDHLRALRHGTSKTSSGSRPKHPVAFKQDTVFALNSSESKYWIYVPKSYDRTHATPITLFVWSHGCGGESAGDIYTVSPGGAQSYIAITVGGREDACWDPNTDQPKLLAAIADVKSHFNINPRRVILGGYSSGGDLSYRTAFYHAKMFAGLLAENTTPFRDTGSSQEASLAAAAWKFHVVHLAHTEDDTYPIDVVRQETNAMADAGFPIKRIERPGGHYDADSGDTGTDHDLRTLLLPRLKDRWLSPP